MTEEPIHFLQLNCHKSQIPFLELLALIPSGRFILLLQEPPVNLPSLPRGTCAYWSSDTLKSTAIISNLSFLPCPPSTRTPNSTMVSFPQFNLHVGSLYLRTPDEIQDTFEMVCGYAPLGHLICGIDSNAWHESWGSPTGPTCPQRLAGSQIFETLSALHLHIHQPTPGTPHPPTFDPPQRRFSSWIDFTFSNCPNLIQNWVVLEETSSDHNLIAFDLSLTRGHESVGISRQVHTSAILKDLSTLDPPDDLDTPDKVDSATADLIEHVNALARRHRRHHCNGPSLKPKWWSPKITELSKVAKTARRRCARWPSQANKDLVAAAHANLRQNIEAERKASFRTFLSEASSSSFLRNKMRGATRSSGPEIVDEANQVIRDPTSLLPHFFNTVPPAGLTSALARLDDLQANVEDPPFLRLDDLIWAVAHTKKKACPIFDLGNAWLQLISESAPLARHVLDLFNSSIKMGHFPAPLRLGQAVLIPKSNRFHPFKPSDVRPISLLPCLAKIFDRIVYRLLSRFTYSKGLLDISQFGFRPGRSTADLNSSRMLELESVKEFAILNVDIKGAFNFLSPRLLLDVVNSLPPFHASIILSYTLKRQVELFCGPISSRVGIFCPVPQGGICSPLILNLCLAFVTARLRPLLNNVTILYAYADDHSPTVFSGNLAHISEAVDAVTSAITEADFTISPKTEILVRTPAGALTPPSIAGFPVVQRTKILGLLFDRQLSFVPHALASIEAARRRFLGLLPFLRRDFGPSPSRALQLVRSVIVPILTHDIAIWCGALKHVRKEIRLLFVFFAKHCFRVFKRSSSEALLHLAGFHNPVEWLLDIAAVQILHLDSALPSIGPRFEILKSRISRIRTPTQSYKFSTSLPELPPSPLPLLDFREMDLSSVSGCWVFCDASKQANGSAGAAYRFPSDDLPGASIQLPPFLNITECELCAIYLALRSVQSFRDTHAYSGPIFIGNDNLNACRLAPTRENVHLVRLIHELMVPEVHVAWVSRNCHPLHILVDRDAKMAAGGSFSASMPPALREALRVPRSHSKAILGADRRVLATRTWAEAREKLGRTLNHFFVLYKNFKLAADMPGLTVQGRSVLHGHNFSPHSQRLYGHQSGHGCPWCNRRVDPNGLHLTQECPYFDPWRPSTRFGNAWAPFLNRIGKLLQPPRRSA